MAAAATLDFRYRKFLFADGIWRTQSHHCTEFCLNCSFRYRDIAIFRIFDFSRWRPPPSWIFEIVKFYLLLVSGGPRRITVPNFENQSFRILRFFESGVQRLETHQHAKFCQNRSIGCKYIKIFRFFKMAAVGHLGFVWSTFGPPTVNTSGSLSL